MVEAAERPVSNQCDGVSFDGVRCSLEAGHSYVHQRGMGDGRVSYWSDTGGPQGPREDWYCKCREVAPDRSGTVPVLRPARNARCLACYTDAPWVIPVFDTDEPQGSSPTASSEEKFEGGGAGLNLDQLAHRARVIASGDTLYTTRTETMLAHDVLALVERVKALEAALAQAPTRRDVNDWTWDNFQRVARAALAAAGGPDGQ